MPWSSIKWLVLLCIVVTIYLWFRHVGRVMKARLEAVEAAAKQRQEVRLGAGCREVAECSAVLQRSESIYSQAAVMYTQALEHPLYWLPATVMGYRPLQEDDSAPKS